MQKLSQIGAGHALGVAVSYLAVLALMAVILAVRVVRVRRAERIGLGDGDNRMLNRRIRAHGNFSEYAPFLALLLLALPLVGAREWLVHLVGMTGLVGRILHAAGISRSGGASWPRVSGMILTFAAIATGAVGALLLAWM
jgi:uncharacterized protein